MPRCSNFARPTTWPRRRLSRRWSKRLCRCSSAKPKPPASCARSRRSKKKSPPRRWPPRRAPKPRPRRPLLPHRSPKSQSHRHPWSKHRSPRLLPHRSSRLPLLRSSRLRRHLWSKLRLLPRSLHRLPRQHQLFRAVPPRANRSVTSLVKYRVRPHRDPTRRVRPPRVRPEPPPLAVRLDRRPAVP